MLSGLRGNWRSLLLAVGLHLVLIGLLVFSIRFGGIVPAGATPEKIVDAVVVYPDRVSEPEPPEPEETAVPTPPLPEPDDERLRQRLEDERQAVEESLARERAEAEARVREEAEAERRRREQARIAEAKRKAEEEARAKAEAERKAQAAAEAKRKAEEQARQKAEEEARRKAEAEAARKAEEERRRAMQDALAAESRQRERAALAEARAKYQQAIKDHVEARWLRPPGTSDIKCDVRVQQLVGGQIIDFELLDSCGSEAADRSVAGAIRKSDPLPRAEPRDVFESEIIFTFQPETP